MGSRQAQIMERFYHIDRGQKLKLGQPIELAHQEDVAPIIEEMYSDGLSRFGRDYSRRALATGDELRIVDGQLEGLNMDGLYDSFFELVRRDSFPEKPSRFQSIFCWEEMSTVVHFIENHAEYPVTVWEIEGEGYHKADWNLLRAETFAHGIQNAHRYWRGDETEEPIWEIVMPLPVTVAEKVADVDGPGKIPNF